MSLCFDFDRDTFFLLLINLRLASREKLSLSSHMAVGDMCSQRIHRRGLARNRSWTGHCRILSCDQALKAPVPQTICYCSWFSITNGPLRQVHPISYKASDFCWQIRLDFLEHLTISLRQVLRLTQEQVSWAHWLWPARINLLLDVIWGHKFQFLAKKLKLPWKSAYFGMPGIRRHSFSE